MYHWESESPGCADTWLNASNNFSMEGHAEKDILLRPSRSLCVRDAGRVPSYITGCTYKYVIRTWQFECISSNIDWTNDRNEASIGKFTKILVFICYTNKVSYCENIHGSTRKEIKIHVKHKHQNSSNWFLYLQKSCFCVGNETTQQLHWVTRYLLWTQFFIHFRPGLDSFFRLNGRT